MTSTFQKCQGHEKQRLGNCYRLKKIKETWQLNDMLISGLNPGPQTWHEWKNWWDLNKAYEVVHCTVSMLFPPFNNCTMVL